MIQQHSAHIFSDGKQIEFWDRYFSLLWSERKKEEGNSRVQVTNPKQVVQTCSHVGHHEMHRVSSLPWHYHPDECQKHYFMHKFQALKHMQQMKIQY